MWVQSSSWNRLPNLASKQNQAVLSPPLLAVRKADTWLQIHLPNPSQVFWKGSLQLLQEGIPCWSLRFLPTRVDTITITPEEEFFQADITAGELQAAVRIPHHLTIDWIMYLIFKRCPSLYKALRLMLDPPRCYLTVESSSHEVERKKSSRKWSWSPWQLQPHCSNLMHWKVVHHHSSQPLVLLLDQQSLHMFMPTSPGCVEHHPKLATIFAEAKTKHKSLVVCWINLANAGQLLSFPFR